MTRIAYFVKPKEKHYAIRFTKYARDDSHLMAPLLTQNSHPTNGTGGNFPRYHPR